MDFFLLSVQIVSLLSLSETKAVHEPKYSNTLKYKWKTSEWGACYVQTGCGQGLKERDVWCVEQKGNRSASTTEISLCDPAEEPPRTLSCFIACHHHKEYLIWKTDAWSPCKMSENQLSFDSSGLRSRNVSCVITSGESSMISAVVDDENCLEKFPRPVTEEDCEIPIAQDCVVTEPSDWTPCCDGIQYRTLSVLVPPANGGQPCPELSEWRSCDGDDKSCNQRTPGYRLKVDKWSGCTSTKADYERSDGVLADSQVLSDTTKADNFYKHWPQVGTQRRNLICYNASGSIVNPGLCGTDQQMPSAERACIMAQDCVVSDWSDWKVKKPKCATTYGQDGEVTYERKREILRLREGQGIPCPHLTETRVKKQTLPHCSEKYEWQVSPWTRCLQPFTKEAVQCGGGLQYRNITCIDLDTKKPLERTECLQKGVQHINTVQRCEVPCPRDCLVGQWGPWGSCVPEKCPVLGEPMPSKGFRKRSRPILVTPSEDGMECPSLEEIQPCSSPECSSWSTGPWGSCQLGPGHNGCGIGKKIRSVTCVSHTESLELLPDWQCPQEKPSREETCILPCAYDCVVSGWSQWSPCSRPCSTETQIGLRQRNRTIIAPAGPRGHKCPDPGELLQVDKCNEHGCHGYSWLALPWKPCEKNCGFRPCEKICGLGRQSRDVWCVKDSEHRVADEMCKGLTKPDEDQNCRMECAEDIECDFGPWSEWTDCPVHHCDSADLMIGTQRRIRVSKTSIKCGPLEEVRACNMSSKPCISYKWNEGEWSQCQLPEGQHCGHGLRTRDLWCSETNSSQHVELHHCLSSKLHVPVSAERCHVDCQTPCQLNEWSHWSSCSQPCTGTRSRTRQLIGASANHPACLEVNLVETSSCPCAEYNPRPISNWSTCLSNSTELCGAGTRYRAVGCYDKDDNLVDPSLCGGSTGLEDEPCLIECPVDCVMSEWSSWGSCSSLCGPGMQNRTRQVLQPPLNGGRECGELVQTKVCGESCEYFKWHASGWTDCSLISANQKQGCGTGDQFRRVRCTDIRTGAEVRDAYCDWTEQPADFSACHTACPGDCVLGPWSEWSPCSKGCPANEEQRRTRTQLRASSGSGAPCPHSIQTQICQFNVTCFTYKWVLDGLGTSSCIPLGGSPCGEGRKTKTAYCQRSDGRPVSDSWCNAATKPRPLESLCFIDCPVDCEFLGWSPWSKDKCNCNDTEVSRYAYIGSTRPSQTGRKCPSPEEQWKPCPAVPCYSWHSSKWSACQLHGAVCGYGFTSRNVTCIREKDGAIVEPFHCNANSKTAQKPATWESCYIPCQTDCQLSQWSRWSHCHGDCSKDTTGYQTRSRTVLQPHNMSVTKSCPEPLWETRDCSLEPCFTMDWSTTLDGQVVCRRSDGLIVVGGCDNKVKPTAGCELIDGRCVCTGDAGTLIQTSSCADHFADHFAEVRAWRYLPKDDELNLWMFAMVGIGCVFFIFVASSIYLLCLSTRQSECVTRTVK